MSDQDAIAAFLAKHSPTVCAPAAAYGADKGADKAKRNAARSERDYQDGRQGYRFVHNAYYGEVRVNADGEPC